MAELGGTSVTVDHRCQQAQLGGVFVRLPVTAGSARSTLSAFSQSKPRVVATDRAMTSNMAKVEAINLEHTPADKPVYVALFQDVRNAAEVKQHLLSGNGEFEYAFIDASVV